MVFSVGFVQSGIRGVRRDRSIVETEKQVVRNSGRKRTGSSSGDGSPRSGEVMAR
jgi:hypothetical protein